MKNHSEDSPLQLRTSKKLASTNYRDKHMEQEHLISTVTLDMFTTVHSPAFKNTQIFLTEATLMSKNGHVVRICTVISLLPS